MDGTLGGVRPTSYILDPCHFWLIKSARIVLLDRLKPIITVTEVIAATVKEVGDTASSKK